MKIPGDIQIEDIVYMKTDMEQRAHIITGAVIRPDGIQYLVSNNGLEYNQYAFEITKERNKLMALGVENGST